MIGSQIKTYESILYIIIFISKKKCDVSSSSKKERHNFIAFHFFIRKLYEDTQWNK